MRKQLESAVVGVNKHLKSRVSGFDWIELLRNCHPLYRADFARTLHNEGHITEDEMKEFTVRK